MIARKVPGCDKVDSELRYIYIYICIYIHKVGAGRLQGRWLKGRFEASEGFSGFRAFAYLHFWAFFCFFRGATTV